MPTLRQLDRKHDSYDADEWADLDALYKGGKAFRARIRRFLPPNPMEPEEVYARRQYESYYRSYVGPIVNYFVAWLFSAPFHVAASRDGTKIDLPPFYAEWKEDVADDCDLVDFMRDRMKVALAQGCSHWLVKFPDDGGPEATDRADFDQRGLGNARLAKVDRAEIYDWECDEDGKLLWVNVHETRTPRESIRADRNVVVERWHVYDDADVETFELRYQRGQRPSKDTDVPSLGKRPHGAKQVPLVTLGIADGLAIGPAVRDAQLEHCRVSNGLSWMIRRTCYAMPIFKARDKQDPPTMGVGYYQMIDVSEDFFWAAPDNGPFATIATEKDSQRDEIYRITHQLALGVDNNAAAVGRSGESKDADAAATRVMLNEFGRCVCKAIEETYEILSDGRGDEDLGFSVEGMDAFDTQSAASLLENLTSATMLDIPSKTFRVETLARAANALLPDADEKVKQAIRQEIEAGAVHEDDLRSLETEANKAVQEQRAEMAKQPPAPPNAPPGRMVPRGAQA